MRFTDALTAPLWPTRSHVPGRLCAARALGNGSSGFRLSTVAKHLTQWEAYEAILTAEAQGAQLAIMSVAPVRDGNTVRSFAPAVYAETGLRPDEWVGGLVEAAHALARAGNPSLLPILTRSPESWETGLALAVQEFRQQKRDRMLSGDLTLHADTAFILGQLYRAAREDALRQLDLTESLRFDVIYWLAVHQLEAGEVQLTKMHTGDSGEGLTFDAQVMQQWSQGLRLFRVEVPCVVANVARLRLYAERYDRARLDSVLATLGVIGITYERLDAESIEDIREIVGLIEEAVEKARPLIPGGVDVGDFLAAVLFLSGGLVSSPASARDAFRRYPQWKAALSTFPADLALDDSGPGSGSGSGGSSGSGSSGSGSGTPGTLTPGPVQLAAGAPGWLIPAVGLGLVGALLFTQTRR